MARVGGQGLRAPLGGHAAVPGAVLQRVRNGRDLPGQRAMSRRRVAGSGPTRSRHGTRPSSTRPSRTPTPRGRWSTTRAGRTGSGATCSMVGSAVFPESALVPLGTSLAQLLDRRGPDGRREIGADPRDVALQQACPCVSMPMFGPLPTLACGQRMVRGAQRRVPADAHTPGWTASRGSGNWPERLPLPYGLVHERIAFYFGGHPDPAARTLHRTGQGGAAGRGRRRAHLRRTSPFAVAARARGPRCRARPRPLPDRRPAGGRSAARSTSTPTACTGRSGRRRTTATTTAFGSAACSATWIARGRLRASASCSTGTS